MSGKDSVNFGFFDNSTGVPTLAQVFSVEGLESGTDQKEWLEGKLDVLHHCNQTFVETVREIPSHMLELFQYYCRELNKEECGPHGSCVWVKGSPLTGTVYSDPGSTLCITQGDIRTLDSQICANPNIGEPGPPLGVVLGGIAFILFLIGTVAYCIYKSSKKEAPTTYPSVEIGLAAFEKPLLEGKKPGDNKSTDALALHLHGNSENPFDDKPDMYDDFTRK